MVPELHDLPHLSERQSKYIRSLQQKKYRDTEGAFVAEGLRLCEEALDASVVVKQAMVTPLAFSEQRVQHLVNRCLHHNISVFLASPKQFKQFTDAVSPQGIALVIQKPQPPEILPAAAPVVLALDALQDPGNMGTLLRTAEWFGIHSILLGHGSVEAFNPKVVRSAMGAVFRCTLFEDADLETLLPQYQSQGYRIIGATQTGDCELPDILASDRDVLVLGNEAHGLSKRVSAQLDVSVRIRKLGTGESLNAAVAGAICMYHLTQ